jgi:hypothetical protein
MIISRIECFPLRIPFKPGSPMRQRGIGGGNKASNPNDCAPTSAPQPGDRSDPVSTRHHQQRYASALSLSPEFRTSANHGEREDGVAIDGNPNYPN